MSSIIPTQGPSRQIERRGNARRKPASIIYAHMSSENGGIVVNLGVGGVAFRAAMKVTAEPNSPLTLRLRGSGMNVEIPGEVAWLGTTQKEVGVCFKTLSDEAQRQITQWIARENGRAQSVPAPVQPEPKLSPVPRTIPPATSTPVADEANSASATASMDATGERPRRRSLAAALAMSEVSLFEAPSIPAGQEPAAAPSLNSVPPTLVPESLFFVPLAEAPAGASTAKSPARDGEHFKLLSQLTTLESALTHPIASDTPPTSALEQTLFQPLDHYAYAQTSAAASVPAIPSENFSSLVSENTEMPTAQHNNPAANGRPTHELEPSLGGAVAEHWIPPALGDAWKPGNARQKLILAGLGAGCLLVALGLIVMLMPGRSGGSGASAKDQTPAPIAPVSAPEPPRAPHVDPAANPRPVAAAQVARTQPAPVSAPGPAAASTAAASTATPQPREAEPSAIQGFFSNLFRIGTGSSAKISDTQVRVEVWISKTAGYYYCTDTDYYKSVQPGRFMSQGDALQRGYRPRLGQFCD